MIRASSEPAVHRLLRTLARRHARRTGLCIGFLYIATALPPPRCAAQQSAGAECPARADADALLAGQRWNDATLLLRTTVLTHPQCGDAHYLLGYVLLRANQPEASLKAYTEAAKLRPPNSEDFTAIASDYILLNSLTDAQRWLLRAVEMAPVSPQAWYLLGRTQYNLGLDAKAANAFQHSLAVLPEDVRSEYNLGLAYERLEKPDLARKAYETAIAWSEQKNAPDAQPYLDLGVLTRSQARPGEALPLLQKAAALSPGNPLVFQELGRTLIDLHRDDEAITALNKAIALAPSAEPPHFFLGRLYRAAGKASEAEEQFLIVQKLLRTSSSGTTPNIDSVHE